MRQIVLPIKDDEVLKQVQDTLLNNFKSARQRCCGSVTYCDLSRQTFSMTMGPSSSTRLLRTRRPASGTRSTSNR